jgi:predicted HTH transcriptional regulator
MLSEETKKLLSREEDVEMEFKETISKKLTDTMVAMANCNGGFILIGVRDSEDESERQIGEIVGISISDENKLKIVQQAQSIMDKLFPAIKDETDEKGRSIYIVQISEGTRKPYCTQGGRYLIRADGNNTSITPVMMEDLILERITARTREPKEEVQPPLETFQRKLSELFNRFRDEWVIERDSEPSDIADAKYILEEYFEKLLDFKSQTAAVEGTNLPEILANVLKGIKALLQRQVYMDGGKSYNQFWESGDQVLELLKTALEESRQMIK